MKKISNKHLFALAGASLLLVALLVSNRIALLGITKTSTQIAAVGSLQAREKYSTADIIKRVAPVNAQQEHPVIGPDIAGTSYVTSSAIAKVSIRPNDGADRPMYTGSYLVELSQPSIVEKFKTSIGSSKVSLKDSTVSLASHRSAIKKQQDNFVSSLPSSVRQNITAKYGSIRNIKKFDTVINAVLIPMTASEASQVSKISGVIRVEPEQIVRLDLAQSVPQIKADKAWEVPKDAGLPIIGRNVKVGIIDTGIDYNHQDLGRCLGSNVFYGVTVNCKVAGGYDFVNNDNDPMDDMGHGTHVADIVAGNGTPKGVAWGATLYAYKVLDQNGSGNMSDVIAGIERSVDPNQDGDTSDHLDVVNLSLGASGGNPDDIVSQAVDNAVDAGVVVVVSAGNSGPNENTVGTPGVARKAITVGAVDKRDSLAYFSSRGPVIWSDGNGNIFHELKPDVVAPGVDICAARHADSFADHDTSCAGDNIHVALSGTSMAAPHVAGEAAILLQKHPDWTPTQVKQAIMSGTDDISLSGYYGLTEVGTGRINVWKALNSNMLPTAYLDPIQGEGGTLHISGIATANNFATYSLAYQQANTHRDMPWTDFSISDHGGSSKLGVLDTANLTEGPYYLRLTVTDSEGNVGTAYQYFIVNNFSITAVGNNHNYIRGGVQGVYGFMSPQVYSVFKVVDANNENKIYCSGQDVLSSDLICNADFGTVSNGKLKIKLMVEKDGHWISDEPFNVAIVRELLNNWPQQVSGITNGLSNIINDASGMKMLVPYYFNDENGYYHPISLFYSSDGQSSVIKQLSNGGHVPDDPAPSIYERNDNRPLIASQDMFASNVVVYDTDGQVKSTWKADSRFNSPVTIFNRSGIGNAIYSVGYGNGYRDIKINGYSLGGKPISGFPISLQQNANQSLFYMLRPFFLYDGTAHNIGIVAGNYGVEPNSNVMNSIDIYAYILSNDNKVIKKTKLYSMSGIKTILGMVYPISADLDNDGSTELFYGFTLGNYDDIVNGHYTDDTVQSFIVEIDSAGNLVGIKRTGNNQIVNSLSVSTDKDGNGILIALLGDSYANMQNSILALDSHLDTVFSTNINDRASSAVSGDIDNDGRSEIVIPHYPIYDSNSNSGIYILNTEGQIVRDIVIPTLGLKDTLYSPILTDFDHDGNTDLLLQSVVDPLDLHSGFGNTFTTLFYAIRLGGAFSKENMIWPSVFKDAQNTSCYNCHATSTDKEYDNPLFKSAQVTIEKPTLRLIYDKDGGESMLSGSFIVTVKAGTEPVMIDKSSAMGIYVANSLGYLVKMADTTYTKYATNEISPIPTPSVPQKYFSIAPGESLKLYAIGKVNPKILFAGQYHMYFAAIAVSFGQTWFNQELIYPDKNSQTETNTVTIVGEVSPYIATVSPFNINVGDTLVIQGDRFKDAGNTVVYEGPVGEPTSKKYSESVASTDSGHIIKIKPNVPVGYYNLHISDSVTGDSNIVSFSVGISEGKLYSAFMLDVQSKDQSVGGASSNVNRTSSVAGTVSPSYTPTASPSYSTGSGSAGASVPAPTPNETVVPAPTVSSPSPSSVSSPSNSPTSSPSASPVSFTGNNQVGNVWQAFKGMLGL